MKFLLPALLAIGLTSCSKDILFATHTSIGLDVSGDTSKAPDHINLGYRRRELAYVGRNVRKDTPMLGAIDAETTWSGGMAIRETFATGVAADAIASGKALTKDGPITASNQTPLTFASHTRLGFHLDLGGAGEEAIPTVQAGYSRSIATHMRIPPGTVPEKVPSVVADTSVHSSGWFGAAKAPKGSLNEAAQLSRDDMNTAAASAGGLRVRQTFAIGKGARYLLSGKAAAPLAANDSSSAAETPTKDVSKELQKIIAIAPELKK